MQQPANARILTTHTGSLPRPPDLSEMMLQRDGGLLNDEDAVRARIASATTEVVRRQADIGIDVLNDGEYGKISYSGYVKERLNGFDGEPRPRTLTDPEFPDSRAGPTIARVRYPTNNGPVELRDPSGVRRDIANLQAALDGVSYTDVFMSAASPGVIDTFMPSTYYGSEADYLQARGRGDARRVPRHRRRRLRPAAGLPRPGHESADALFESERPGVPGRHGHAHPGLERGDRRLTARADPAAPVLGQLRRAAHSRCTARRGAAGCARSAGRRAVVRGGQSAARPRVESLQAGLGAARHGPDSTGSSTRAPPTSSIRSSSPNG